MTRQDWCAVGSDSANAVAAVDALVREMDARIAAVRHRRTDQMSLFSSVCPLLLVVVEEWPGTLALARAQDDLAGRRGSSRHAARLEHGLLRLVAEGAKVGVRVVLVAQRAEAAWLSGYVRGQFSTRVTLRVDNRASVEMLHDEVPPELVRAVIQFQPGEALYEAPGQARQIVRMDHTPYAAYLTSVDSTRAQRAAARAEGASAARACLLGHLRPTGGRRGDDESD